MPTHPTPVPLAHCDNTSRRHLRPKAAQAAFAITLAIFSASALATEGGGNSYAMGVETNFSGMMLPEGAHVFTYYAHYEAGRSKDNNGNNNPALARFNARSDVVAARFSYVWPGISLLGAAVETRLAQAVPTLNITLDVARPAPLGPLNRGGSLTGLGDLTVAPLILGWHAPTVHQSLGFEMFLRTGSYDVGRNVNTGRNYNQYAGFYAITWMPNKDVELSTKFRYATNDSNKATNYQSGDEATLEFGGGYRVAPNWVLGASGYVYRQTTDDTLNGVVVNGNGNRGRVNAFGPMVTYSVTPRFSVIAKLQSEFGARNKSEGTRLWVQAKIPF